MRRRERHSRPPIIPRLFGIYAVEILPTALRHSFPISAIRWPERSPLIITAITFRRFHHRRQGLKYFLLILEQTFTISATSHQGEAELHAVILPVTNSAEIIVARRLIKGHQAASWTRIFHTIYESI